MKKLAVLAALAVVMTGLLLFNGGQRAIAFHPAGPVAYWPFDDGADPTADASGHGNVGDVVGDGATFGGGNIAPIPGNVDAIEFDGLGTNAEPDYVQVPDDDDLTPSGSALTISAWIYPQDVTGLQMIFGRWHDNTKFEYELQMWSGQIKFWLGNELTVATSATTLGSGSWYHVAGVWNGSNLQIYIDGSPDGSSVAFAGSVSNTDTFLSIGGQRWSAQWWRFFDGVIDDVRIYDRALSADEVAILANGDDVYDGCETTNDGNDIESVVATSDGSVITVVVTLCGNIVQGTKYRVHFDYADPLFSVSGTTGDRNGDTVIDGNDFCATTSDDTMMLVRRGGGDKITGPSTTADPIDPDTNVLTYTVKYSDLNVLAGNTVAIWVDTQNKGIVDRAPNTDDSDGCSKPENENEVIEIELAS